ncbi:hypothetical protein [Streptomyces varsoviensis]|uniref:Uncharacterized protein n=1 Tax=Streptomyces varsoviensis TaxID=67373 RepID=A0ABR5J6U4_9ACTN|nr:hypothetical protein [Streptomyces varsoviensis]KOG89191.1 hypothetical protein ADK38_15655 [Streptomyces varsoviensis]
MTHRGAPNQGPLRALLGHHRTLVAGVIGALAGATGTVSAVSGDAGVLEILAFAGIGVLGLLLAIAYVLAYAQRPR